MSPFVILGIIACFSPILTIMGMIFDDLTFWFIFDIYAIIFFPLVGISLIKKFKNNVNK